MRVRIGPYRKNRATRVEIEPHDTWSMDCTLALIIHPMLVQLKETTHGYPNQLTEERWNEILDEIIWAFEQKCKDDWQDDYYGDYVEDPKNGPMAGSFEWVDHDGMRKHQERMTAGFKLFGEYYENLWD
jgi:hypothetical protein